MRLKWWIANLPRTITYTTCNWKKLSMRSVWHVVVKQKSHDPPFPPSIFFPVYSVQILQTHFRYFLLPDDSLLHLSTISLNILHALMLHQFTVTRKKKINKNAINLPQIDRKPHDSLLISLGYTSNNLEVNRHRHKTQIERVTIEQITITASNIYVTESWAARPNQTTTSGMNVWMFTYQLHDCN